MTFTDTHCHVHSMLGSGSGSLAKRWAEAAMTADEIVDAATTAGVRNLICVGTDLADSEKAVEFVRNREHTWASVGVHPHDAAEFMANPSNAEQLGDLAGRKDAKIVAIGECGLDYYYENSPKNEQQAMLRLHLELAQRYNLPLIFHIRDAFEDFWPIFDEFHAQKALQGVVHSFTAHETELTQALDRGLYVALNGIVTFSKDEKQLQAAKLIPLDRLLLETDAPFLTPKPLRGKICKPEHIVLTAEFLAGFRGEALENIAAQTTQNAIRLFNLAK